MHQKAPDQHAPLNKGPLEFVLGLDLHRAVHNLHPQYKEIADLASNRKEGEADSDPGREVRGAREAEQAVAGDQPLAHKGASDNDRRVRPAADQGQIDRPMLQPIQAIPLDLQGHPRLHPQLLARHAQPQPPVEIAEIELAGVADGLLPVRCGGKWREEPGQVQEIV